MGIRLSEKQWKAIENRHGKAAVSAQATYNLASEATAFLALAATARHASPYIVTIQTCLKLLSNRDTKSMPYERIEQAIALLWLSLSAPYEYAFTMAIPLGGYRPQGAGGQVKGDGAKPG